MLVLGFGHLSKLTCEPNLDDPLRCWGDRAVAWGLIPTTQSSLEASPAQVFPKNYHEPLYLLAVSGALLVLSSSLAIAGLRRNT